MLGALTDTSGFKAKLKQIKKEKTRVSPKIKFGLKGYKNARCRD